MGNLCIKGSDVTISRQTQKLWCLLKKERPEWFPPYEGLSSCFICRVSLFRFRPRFPSYKSKGKNLFELFFVIIFFFFICLKSKGILNLSDPFKKKVEDGTENRNFMDTDTGKKSNFDRIEKNFNGMESEIYNIASFNYTFLSLNFFLFCFSIGLGKVVPRDVFLMRYLSGGKSVSRAVSKMSFVRRAIIVT